MKTPEHSLGRNAMNFARMHTQQRERVPIGDGIRKKVISGAMAILMGTASPAGGQEASDVLFSVDKELLFHELGDEDLYNYYMNLLSNGDVHVRLGEVFQDIHETIGFRMQGIDITFFLDLDAARYSGDDILWMQAYDDIINFYSAFSDDLDKILTQHGYNPHDGELV